MLLPERFNGSRDGREDLLHHRCGGKYNLVDDLKKSLPDYLKKSLTLADRAIFAAKTNGGLGPSDVADNERA